MPPTMRCDATRPWHMININIRHLQTLFDQTNRAELPIKTVPICVQSSSLILLLAAAAALNLGQVNEWGVNATAWLKKMVAVDVPGVQGVEVGAGGGHAAFISSCSYHCGKWGEFQARTHLLGAPLLHACFCVRRTVEQANEGVSTVFSKRVCLPEAPTCAFACLL
jgi:hypothetical protein